MSGNGDVLAAMVPQLELLPELDEKGRRLVPGAVVRAGGDGGIGAVARLTGASWQTVADGAAELASLRYLAACRFGRLCCSPRVQSRRSGQSRIARPRAAGGDPQSPGRAAGPRCHRRGPAGDL